MKDIVASVIVPVYNEEKYIENFLMSLKEQSYDLSKIEWIFVDGNSTDNTKKIIEQFSHREKFPVILLDNKQRKTPQSLNMAIGCAKGKYIIRLDAHARYYPEYIEKCIYYLDNMDIDNVGGVAETKSNGFVGKAISKMLSTKFGVGDSGFRVGEGNRYVDTVPFGAFRRETFEKVGLFNTKLLRSEDNDINARIRENGGKIWLSEDIRFEYFCRDTVSGILKMALQNGNALFHTLRANPKAMSVRHCIPFLFVLSLIFMTCMSIIFPLVFGILFAIELGLYFMINVYFSFVNKFPQYGLVTIWLYPLFHITYGIGSLLGLFGVELY